MAKKDIGDMNWSQLVDAASGSYIPESKSARDARYAAADAQTRKSVIRQEKDAFRHKETSLYGMKIKHTHVKGSK